jgi:hypothetical protein
MSNKYINNYIRDDSSLDPKYLSALKLDEKVHKPVISNLYRPHFERYPIMYEHLNKPKYKINELKHVPNNRKYKVNINKEIHHIHNPQNKLRGIPDLKIKPEEQTIVEELGTKGMTDKDFAKSNLLKENGSLDTFGLRTESHMRNSTIDEARIRFMNAYTARTSKRRAVPIPVEPVFSGVPPLKSTGRTRRRAVPIPVAPIVEPVEEPVPVVAPRRRRPPPINTNLPVEPPLVPKEKQKRETKSPTVITPDRRVSKVGKLGDFRVEIVKRKRQPKSPTVITPVSADRRVSKLGKVWSDV